MRLTQGAFSFLPDLTEGQIRAQVDYCLKQNWALNLEYTDDPHPRNSYWELYGLPLFDQKEAAPFLRELEGCRKAFPRHYIKINAYDTTKSRETVALSFIVHRPAKEPGFRLVRQETGGRSIRYTIESYAAQEPGGERYSGD